MSMDIHRIGILMPDTIEGHEIADYIETELIQRGYEAEIRYAEIADWQPDQARDLIDCECKILILWALQAQAWEWLEEYEEIQVIALMTLVRISGVIKYYLGFNYREVGRQQGEYIEEALDLSSGANCNIELFSSPDSRKINEILMGALEILQPYLDDGGLTGEIHDITLLDSWTKENAYIYMVNLINKKSYTPSNRSLGAVCCCVDEFARGIIEALTEMGFDSDTMPVITSFGTSEETLDNLALRLQSMTILMDYVGIAERLVYVVDALIGGMELEASEIVNNEYDNIPADFSCGILQEKEPEPSTPTKILKCITIDREPNTKNYYIGEAFDPEGMIVTAHYYNADSRDVTHNCSYSPKELTIKNTFVTVSYSMGGITATATQTVTVREKKIVEKIIIATPPNKTIYEEGESFDKTGMVVRVDYTDGTSQNITNYTTDAPNKLSYPDRQITIFYNDGENGYNAIQPITVKYHKQLWNELEPGEYLQIAYYAVNSADNRPVEYTGDLVLGQEGNYILIIQGTLDIARICKNLDISKSDLIMSDLQIELLSSDNSIPEYNILDASQNLIASYRTTEKKGIYSYKVPIDKLISDANIPDYVAFTITPRGTQEVTSTLRKKWIHIKVGYRVDITSLPMPDTTADVSKSSNDYGSNPKINLATGRTLYEFGDMSIGSNNYEIVISHQYNSALIKRYETLGLGMGKGWKLNIHQHIWRSATSTEGDIYGYVDGAGYCHEFVPISRLFSSEEASKTYVDTEGKGLTLVYPYHFNSEVYFLLKDTTGNCTLFNANGKIAMIIAAPVDWECVKSGNANAIVFEYVDEKVSKVYAQRNRSSNGRISSYIEFNYDTKGLLTTMKAQAAANSSVETLKTIGYEYNSCGDLLAVTKKVGNNQKEISRFEYYPYSLLKSIVETDTNSATQLSYNTNYKADKISFGYVTDVKNMATFVEKSHHKFFYKIYFSDNQTYPQETMVENEKDILLSYNFNRSGEITAAFEKAYPQAEILTTLTKETGKLLGGSAADYLGEKINGEVIKYYSDGINNAFASEITPSREGESDTKNFMVTCYVKLTKYINKTVNVIIDFTHGNSSPRYRESIDNKAYNVWQKVSVPVSLLESSSDITIRNFWFGIYDSDGTPMPFYCSPLSFTPCAATKIMLFKDNMEIPVKNMSKMRLNTVLGQANPIELLTDRIIHGENAYFSLISMTYPDLLESAKGIYQSGNTRGAILYGNGLKARLSDITDAEFIYPMALGTEKIFPLIDKATGECGFMLRQYSADNKTITSTYTTFRTDGILTTTEVKSSKKSSSSKVFTSYDGRTIYKEDAYGVREEYSYDDCKNLLEIKLVSRNSSGTILSEMLLQKNKYDNAAEYIEGTESGYDAAAFGYEKPYDVITSSRQKEYNFINNTYTLSTAYKQLQYDEYIEKLKNSSLFDGTTELVKNEVTYENGRIRTVSDGSSKYGVHYDVANDEITYTAFDESVETTIHKRRQSYAADTRNMTFTDIYYRGNGTDTLSVISDAYGKLLSANDGNKTIIYGYTDKFNGSRASYPISSIKDPYENRTYEYSYDHDGQMCGWRTSDNWLTIRQISANETKYILNGSEKYKTKLIYDENVLNDPRIMKTMIYSDPSVNASDDWSEIYSGIVEYDYDSLGRTLLKYNLFNSGMTYYAYEYLTNGKQTLPLLSKCTYYGEKTFVNLNDLSRCDNKIEWQYGYDAKGNVKSIKEIKTSGADGDGYAYTRSTTYNYDDVNRISAEKVVENNNLHVDLTYSYYTEGSGFGKLREITDNQDFYKNRVYSYNSKGQLSSYTKRGIPHNYTYDNYGNVKSKTAMGIPSYSCEWTRGNLLKSFTTAGNTFEYFYNHKNIRHKKVANGITTNYYLDGNKILGEDRSDGTKLRYLYDKDGLHGFRYTSAERPYYIYEYTYIQDGLGNIVGITDSNHRIVALYKYDLYGNTTVCKADGKINDSEGFIGDINPFRWKSHYYDEESELYYIEGRYYEAERCEYIDAMDAPIITDNAYELLGLNRNGLQCLNMLLLLPYLATIATSIGLYTDPLYDPEAGKSWWDKHFVQIFFAAMQILAGIAMMMSGVGSGAGVLMIVSGGMNVLSAALGSELVGAASEAVTGGQAIAAGIQMLSCCPVGGVIAIAAGAMCIKFAEAEAQEALGYGNWMKEAGMSDGWYTGLMIASNVIATAAVIYNQYGPKCFKAGTLVLCKDENGKECRKPIEEIEVGEMVLAYDEETGESDWKPVMRLFRNNTKEWYHVFVDGEEIVCTGGHPFYVVGKGFIEARKLKVSEKLLLSSGKEVIIEKVEVERLAEAETTYNFEVKDFHTYYIGKKSILTHNICEPPIPDDYVPTYKNGTYKQSPKHPTDIPFGGKASPGPSERVGQYFLDNAIPVGNKGSMLAYSGGKKGLFVVFQQTTPGIYHGYYNTFSMLRQPMQNLAIVTWRVWK